MTRAVPLVALLMILGSGFLVAQADAPGSVRVLQTALSRLGYRVDANGSLDASTVLSLKALQRTCNIATTGQPDVATMQCIESTFQAKVNAAKALLTEAESALAAFQTGAPVPPSAEQQRQAAEAARTPPVLARAPVSEPVRADDPSTVIRSHCAAQWPTDFAMRAYCEEQQRQGLASLQHRNMASGDERTIRIKCEREWPDDFRMRDYCETKQLEALESLR